MGNTFSKRGAASAAQAATAAEVHIEKAAKPVPKAIETPIRAESILDLAKYRRSIYTLNKTLPISKDRIQDIVKTALQHVPSAFNSQSNRVVVLFDSEHDKLWDLTTETLRAIVPEDKWAPTAQRMAGFRSGAATILFFEDQEVIEGMQKNVPLYADKFPIWATQSIAMVQFTLWTALEAEGLGANLQHYNPLIDEKVAKEWSVPAHWKLNAQLVIGGRAGEAGPKEFQPVEAKYKVFGA